MGYTIKLKEFGNEDKVVSELNEDVNFEIGMIGEGIVWSCEFQNVVHRFKVKGEKHSASKVKTLAAVDVEKLNSIKEFVDYAVTESRVNQAIENVFPNQEPLDVKKMGDVIRWVVNDVIKEEMDTMIENNLEPKEINKYISTKTREMFLIKLNELVGL
jgi:hypothetical protein